jgi:hypothetical protein
VPLGTAAARSARARAASAANPRVVQGGTVQWQNAGPGNATVADASGMGLFGSQTLKPGGGYAFAFNAAGTYRFTSTGSPASGAVSVPMEAAPSRGRLKTVFQIYWCFCHAPKGYVFDVQIKSPHTGHFRSFVKGTRKGEVAAIPGHGRGTYTFRARLRKKNGKHSDWSPTLAVQVK